MFKDIDVSIIIYVYNIYIYIYFHIYMCKNIRIEPFGHTEGERLQYRQ